MSGTSLHDLYVAALKFIGESGHIIVGERFERYSGLAPEHTYRLWMKWNIGDDTCEVDHKSVTIGELWKRLEIEQERSPRNAKAS